MLILYEIFLMKKNIYTYITIFVDFSILKNEHDELWLKKKKTFFLILLKMSQ